MPATLKTAVKADAIKELVRDAVGSHGRAMDHCIDRIEHYARYEAGGDGYLTPRSLTTAGVRLDLEGCVSPMGQVLWTVWVDVGEGDTDQASRVYHWCRRSDDLTTYQMVSLVKAIKAHEQHEA